MMMTSLLNNLTKVARDIENERPDLTLFAALQRYDAHGMWDIIVAAPWVVTEGYKGYYYVGDFLKKHLTATDMLGISHIVLLPPDDEPVRTIASRTIPWKDGIKQINGDYHINDMVIIEGYVFISKMPSETFETSY